jgi:SSS family solute:Na+ symporter
MSGQIEWVALSVFVFFFALVTVMGFFAARWKSGPVSEHLDEWGLGGRQFGTWITWFLVGGDFYTAYTVIAVPALVYAVGAYGFFALPYTIIVYPFVFAVMPLLWKVAHRNGYVTAADVVHGAYQSRGLELAVAITGIVATMPYIALQLVGMGAVIKTMGLDGEWPIVAAFIILALYTYSSGLRAPALIAFVKDIMIYIVVLTAVVVVPAKLGGYGAVFAAANDAFAAKGGATGLTLKSSQFLAYATVALGSALAAFMYPHTLTGVFASKSADTIRKNAMLLPAYTLLLGLIALLGYMAYAAHIKVGSPNEVVPQLFKTLFPSWFAGFAFAAIGIGALVPAAVMSIGAANLFTRNIWKAYVNPAVTHAGEASVAKITSLVVKVGALAFTLFLPVQYALDLQLLGGLWILQTFPALVFGLFTRWFRAEGLLAGWAVVDGLGQRAEAARDHHDRRHQLFVLCRARRADHQRSRCRDCQRDPRPARAGSGGRRALVTSSAAEPTQLNGPRPTVPFPYSQMTCSKAILNILIGTAVHCSLKSLFL